MVDFGKVLPVPDPLPNGERCPGEVLFRLPMPSQETIVETGLPFSRVYDPLEELWRIRQIYAHEAAMPPRRSQPTFRSRSLRRI
jgi:hypothetical protein